MPGAFYTPSLEFKKQYTKGKKVEPFATMAVQTASGFQDQSEEPLLVVQVGDKQEIMTQSKYMRYAQQYLTYCQQWQHLVRSLSQQQSENSNSLIQNGTVDEALNDDKSDDSVSLVESGVHFESSNTDFPNNRTLSRKVLMRSLSSCGMEGEDVELAASVLCSFKLTA
jgi:hypothetical protein